MNFIFWLLWILDFLLVLLVIQGSKFRSGFGASTDFNTLILIGLVIILIVSVFLKFTFKLRWISILLVALPFIGMLMMFIFEKKTRVG